jgi:hypothetical protein
MGKKIDHISIQRLSNGAHYTFVQTTLGRIEECGAAASRLSADIATLRAAFSREEETLRVARKSRLTKEIVQGDAMRDSSYTGYKMAVKGLLSLPESEMLAAARRLWEHIKSYRIVTTDQRDKQTGMMTSFINDLEGKYAADVTVLGLMPLVTTMKTANEKVLALTSERDTENSVKIVGATKAARLVTDEAYRTLIDKVNALALLEGDEDYAGLIDAMNTQIARYKREALGKKTDDGVEE